MSESEDRAYKRGERAAYVGLLGKVLENLDVRSPEHAMLAWIAEREAIISALRDLCAEVGDNDWPDDLYLPDVIEKHLARHLLEDA